MNRFYTDNALFVGQSLTLPEAVYHHWCKVLRAKVGERAILFNGQGGEYTVTLSDVNKKPASVIIDSFDDNNRTPRYHITLAQAISKGDRMDYTIQKACEMGVSAIQLITTERSDRLRYERDHKKLIHWQGVAIAACEQCGMNLIPKILPPLTLIDYLNQCTDELKLVMAVSPIDNHTPSTPLPQNISILVGAEGGLSDEEVQTALEHGFCAWTLGERILRTETAGVVAMASLQMLDILTPIK